MNIYTGLPHLLLDFPAAEVLIDDDVGISTD